MQKTPGNILIIDDDLDVLYTAQLILKHHYTQVDTEGNPKKALQMIQNQEYDVVLLDMNFAPGVTHGQEGLFWLRKIQKESPESLIILNTAYGEIELAVEAMKRGASDFLVKPWPKEKLLSSVKMVFELKQSRQEVARLQTSRKVINAEWDSQYPDLISKAPVMQAVLKTLEKVATTDANVLILGENGTGKELVARAIHRKSRRSEEAFIKVDLGAIPESLFESELFGHVKGAFTDAREDRAGRFEVASGGTLFLDEIGNLTLPLQAKLLTVLQSRQLMRVGSNQSIPLDIRLICATNSPLYQHVQEGTFRQDLIYRINTVELQLPPLRERQEDIPLLAEYFLQQYTQKYEKPSLKLQAAALNKLYAYPWPGNIRELQHALERAVIMSEGNTLATADFMLGQAQTPTPTATQSSLNVEEMEKAAISAAIRKYQGNLTQAAKELGMGRSTLYRKIDKYKL